jgi:hypothetical protein
MMTWVSKHVKWFFWGLVAVATTFLALMFKGFEVPEKKRKPKIPEVPPKLRERVLKAEEDAVFVRAGVKAREKVQQDELEDIRKISNGRERRRRLAELMSER